MKEQNWPEQREKAAGESNREKNHCIPSYKFTAQWRME